MELSGLPEDLLPVRAENLNAVMNVEDMEFGLNSGSLDLTAPANTAIASVTPFTVIVSDMADGPDAAIVPAEEATGSEAETAEPGGQETDSGERGTEAGGQEPADSTESAP